MNSSALEALKYPIGKFEWVEDLPHSEINKSIDIIKKFPEELIHALNSYTDDLLQKRYRPEGWTIAQLVHHMADSHTHSYVRFKHAVLEETPHIKDYSEVDWASLPDASSNYLEPSLLMLRGIHLRWSLFLEQLSTADFKKFYYHPNRKKNYPIDTATALYAWHCKHHLAHVVNALDQPYQ